MVTTKESELEASGPLASALSTFVSSHFDEMSPYSWQISDVTWSKLGTDFDYKKFSGDPPRQNIEMKQHLAKYWANASINEKIRVSKWIVSDWGGIHRNSDMTILGYINQADAEYPATPFYGIASYSKILAIKAPEGYAVFDARVAASLNAVQLLLRREGKLTSPNLLGFLVPPGRNNIVNRFDSAAPPSVLQRLGFAVVEKDATYDIYLSILRQMKPAVKKSILEIEMFLFAQADDLCERALPLLA